MPKLCAYVRSYVRACVLVCMEGSYDRPIIRINSPLSYFPYEMQYKQKRQNEYGSSHVHCIFTTLFKLVRCSGFNGPLRQ